jgi:uncharacterized protein YbjT (DUF2867 family)
MILITGSTGNIGTPLIRILAATDAKLRALVRDQSQESAEYAAMRSRGVDVVTGDLAAPSSLDAALSGIETAFLLTPVSCDQVAWKSNFIQSAKRAGVKRIVNLSVSGAAPDSPIILGKWHWQSEQELESSGIAWTHLRPYDLARYNTKMFLSTALSQGAFYSTVGDGRIAMVDEEDVAAVAAQALLNPLHDGKAFTLTGPAALSYAEIAAIMTELTGKTIRYVDTPEADARKAMIGAGLPEWIADFINDLRRMERSGGAAAVSRDIEKVTGKPATTFRATFLSLLRASGAVA